MSNPNVGMIYQQIIEDVIETSRVDFEEGGVEESVLEELRKGWQKKLSALHVAQFPWDPKPEPTAPLANPMVNNSSTNYQHSGTPPMAQPQTSFSMPVLPQMQPLDNLNGPRIKTEPGVENGVQARAPPSFNTLPGMTAQQRAADNLAATYGSRAAASISAIQGSMPQQQPQGQKMHAQAPQQNMQQQQQQQRIQGTMQRTSQMTQAQYHQQAIAQQQLMAAQRASQAQQGGVNGAQTDGADERAEDVILTQINARGKVEMGTVEIDNMIREQIEAKGRAIEGGGLMLSLKERYHAGRNKNHRMITKVAAPSSSSSVTRQFDGGDDDDDDKSGILKDEDDEDAINSDLDDPDDGLNDDEDDDEGMGHIMLCMYDKVQRVKNKWKCVMKDGVLTVNGREYVFHKASGEYEW